MANELFKKVIESTGLPLNLIDQELCEILSKKGLDPKDLSEEELRLAMTEYLRQVILLAKERYENGAIIEEEIELEDLEI